MPTPSTFNSRTAPTQDHGLVATLAQPMVVAGVWLRERALATHSKSAYLDVAYDEYCNRSDSGEAIDPESFAEQFPQYRQSLLRLIEVHQFLRSNRDLLEGTDEPWPEVGQKFLGFTLLEELGRGGFARVFLAAEKSLGNRLVAVKIAEQNLTEAETLAQLRHPNVVPIHSVQFDERSNRTLICMPFLGRATLCDLLDYLAVHGIPASANKVAEVVRPAEPVGVPGVESEASVDWQGASYVDAVLKIGVQLADALAYTHRQQICHGDLKPSNVLVTAAGKPMLLDFNLSFRVRDGWQLGGTLPYMAPEQLAVASTPGRSAEGPNVAAPTVASPIVDARADIFSLGVMLFELFTGELPFGSVSRDAKLKDVSEALLERQRKGPSALVKLNPAVDPGLARTINRALAFDPRDRFASAAEFKVALERSASWQGRAKRQLRAHRRLAIAAVSTVCLLLAGFGLWLGMRAPFEERAFHQAESMYLQGDYHGAIDLLNAIVEISPKSANAYFLRGRAWQQLEQYASAAHDYQQSNELRSDARLKAARGYCYSKMGNGPSAVAIYQESAAQGFESAELLNNLGYELSKQGKLEESRIALDRAIELNDRLPAAFHSRGRAKFSKVLRDGDDLANDVLVDFRQAMELGESSAELYSFAADAAVKCAEKDPAYLREGQAYLERAIELGYPINNARSNPFFRKLKIPDGSRMPSDLEIKRAVLILDPLPKSLTSLDS